MENRVQAIMFDIQDYQFINKPVVSSVFIKH